MTPLEPYHQGVHSTAVRFDLVPLTEVAKARHLYPVTSMGKAVERKVSSRRDPLTHDRAIPWSCGRANKEHHGIWNGAPLVIDDCTDYCAGLLGVRLCSGSGMSGFALRRKAAHE